jgi:hypothetical protein
MDARMEVMHSKRPDRPLLATGRDRAEGRREEKLRELGALLPAKLPALEPIREVPIHDEELATRRLSMMRIMARWMKAATVLA